MIATDYFCSELSTTHGEQLFGSAPHNTTWLLLEYNQPWGAKAFPESDLAPAIKQHISEFLKADPAANILFIRQPQPTSGIRFYIAHTQPGAECLCEYQLDSYDDLLTIDFSAPTADHLTDDPVYLVCTNAKRDKCCAKFGLKIYQELREQVGNRAWQCSHLGGHRFAPTTLFLPAGICYGRIEPEAVPALVEQQRDGHLSLHYLRGRVGLAGPLQAADYLLRSERGITAIHDLHIEAAERVADNLWDVNFSAAGKTYNVRLEKTITDVAIYTSCFNDKQAFLEEYRLIAAGS